MRDTDLIAALRSVSVETGSLVCLGCGREHGCSTHGCAILREAAERIEAEQKRRETWHSAETPPDHDGLYWGKKDNTNSMWAVRYSAGTWSLSAYPDTKMPITEWAYWDTFEEEESHG